MKQQKNFLVLFKNKYYVNEIERVKKGLNEQSCMFERLKEDFIKREDQLQKLEQEKVNEMNEILIAKYALRSCFHLEVYLRMFCVFLGRKVF